MITSPRALAALAPLCRDGGAFPSRWARAVARWCVNYYDAHGSSPGRAVESLFGRWAETKEAAGDRETVQLVESFLASLSGEWEAEDQPADEHLISDALDLLLKSAVSHLGEQLQDDAASGNVQQALHRIEAFRTSAAPTGAAGHYDLLRDEDGLRGALERANEDPLVAFRGDYGRMLAPACHRDNLIAYQAPEKRGKSFFLIDFAWTAMKQRRHTLFYAAGDMTREQMHARFAARAARRPLPARTVKYPVKLYRDEEDKHKVTHEVRSWDNPITFHEGWKAYHDAIERYVRDDASYLDLFVHPAGSLTVAAVRAECKRRQQNGRPVDVVVIDYADLMEPPAGHKDERGQVNAVWTALRALSSELRLLVVTATQANAESYRKRTQDMRNFSLDKRKLAHATGIVGINQTDTEKADALYRLNWLVLREDDFVSSRSVVCASCLPLAMPAVRSLF